jgi:hypothetical protein
LIVVDKTVESFWIDLEEENNRWSCFARALRKPDREAFDELIYAFRSYASEISTANKPIIFEPMVMSILLFEQKRIGELEQNLREMQQPNSATASIIQEPKETNPNEPKITIPTAKSEVNKNC